MVLSKRFAPALGAVNTTPNAGALPFSRVGGPNCSEMKEYYNRKIKEGKHHMVVVNNICNNGAARADSASYFRLYFSKRKI